MNTKKNWKQSPAEVFIHAYCSIVKQSSPHRFIYLALFGEVERSIFAKKNSIIGGGLLVFIISPYLLFPLSVLSLHLKI